MVTVTPLPALRDNYIWLVHGDGAAVVVDPGEAAPVLAALQVKGLRPVAVLITHHHWDHVSGVAGLLAAHEIPVYAPAGEPVAHCTHPVQDRSRVPLAALGLDLLAMRVPGHTRGAIAYYGDGCLFSGDTLFAAGCGRLFEGTAQQMHDSLQRLAQLPGDTKLFCGHEYTINNLRFAALVEPANKAIEVKYREALHLNAQGLPTLPSSLASERETNPFLRCHVAAVRAAAERHAGRSLEADSSVFAVLRQWKDGFR
ncbi:MAG: hydroxyacylglutathione hydrolase [Gammaproteobacteria bacterium]